MVLMTLRVTNSGVSESGNLKGKKSTKKSGTDTLPSLLTCRKNPGEGEYLRNSLIGNVKTVGHFNEQ